MTNTARTPMNVNSEKLEIIMSRTYAAPRELVFKVYTDPVLIPQWWGPRRLTTTVDKMDLRPGGEWRFVQHDSDGAEYSFHGVYQEVAPPVRLVYTFEYEGNPPGHALVETVLFEENAGITTVTAIDKFQMAGDMRGMIDSGMESGATESFDRFEELLRSIM